MKRLSPYVRLIRLPNAFTACADVSIGILAGCVGWREASCLAVTSGSLYCAGIAWNDYFDRQIDRLERPERPLPSGAVKPNAAFALAMVLAAIGLSFAALVGVNTFCYSVLLLLAILLYDSWLKNTSVRPLAMGTCRGINVALGFSSTSLSMVPWQPRIAVAALISVYIAGVTLFATDEAHRSRRSYLKFGLALMSLAILAVSAYPTGQGSLHPILCGVLFAALWHRSTEAIRDRTPSTVQRTVKSAILGLIILDAAAAVAVAGPQGYFIIAWMIPTIALGRVADST